jgi:hypothetical protein
VTCSARPWETWIRDQLGAVATDMNLRVQYRTSPDALIGGQLEATRLLTGQLIDALRGGLPLCAHLQVAPSLASWGPGVTSLDCWLDNLSFNILNLGNDACDLCGRDVGASDLLPAMASAGVVLVHGALCRRCRHQPALGRYDGRGVRRIVLDLVAQRYGVGS